MREPLLFEQLGIDQLEPVLVLRLPMFRSSRFEILVDGKGRAILVLPHVVCGGNVSSSTQFNVPDDLWSDLKNFIETHQDSESSKRGYILVMPESSRYLVVWPPEVEPFIGFVEDGFLPQPIVRQSPNADKLGNRFTEKQIQELQDATASSDEQDHRKAVSQLLKSTENSSDPRYRYLSLRSEIELCHEPSVRLSFLQVRERAFLDQYGDYLFWPFKNRNGVMPRRDLTIRNGLLYGAVFNHIDELRAFVERHFNHFPEFREVVIARSVWTDFAFDMETFVDLPHLERLRSLEMRDCRVGESGLRLLTSTPRLKHLERLAIYLEPIGDSLPHMFANAKFESLRSLTIYGTSMTAEGIRELLQAPSTSGLRELYLGNTWLCNRGIDVLASCKNLRGLRSLTLSHSNITENAAHTLANSREFQNLQNLVMVREQVGSKGEAVLQKRFGEAVVFY